MASDNRCSDDLYPPERPALAGIWDMTEVGLLPRGTMGNSDERKAQR